jgi:hypothetical protein
MTLVDLYQTEITRLYAIMDQHKIPTLPTDIALFQTLGSNVRQLKDVMDIAIETREDQILRKYAELELMMQAVFNEVSDIRNRAQDAMVLDPASDALTVLNVIDTLLAQIDKIEKTKTRYENWGKLFHNGGILNKEVAEGEEDSREDRLLYDPRKMEELLETKQEIVLKKNLWSALSDWGRVSE